MIDENNRKKINAILKQGYCYYNGLKTWVSCVTISDEITVWANDDYGVRLDDVSLDDDLMAQFDVLVDKIVDLGKKIRGDK